MIKQIVVTAVVIVAAIVVLNKTAEAREPCDPWLVERIKTERAMGNSPSEIADNLAKQAHGGNPVRSCLYTQNGQQSVLFARCGGSDDAVCTSLFMGTSGAWPKSH